MESSHQNGAYGIIRHYCSEQATQSHPSCEFDQPNADGRIGNRGFSGFLVSVNRVSPIGYLFGDNFADRRRARLDLAAALSRVSTSSASWIAAFHFVCTNLFVEVQVQIRGITR